MQKNPKLEARRKKISLEEKILLDKNFAIMEQIDAVLIKQGKTQKDLAESLDKNESEISKWMRGSHNFTLKTIAKIEAALGESIIVCPKDVKAQEHIFLSFSPNTFVRIKKDDKGNIPISSKHTSSLFVKTNTESIQLEECFELN